MEEEFLDAVESKDRAEIEKLLQAGVDINTPLDEERTALGTLADLVVYTEGEPSEDVEACELMQWLLEQGADPNAREDEGEYTALMYACRIGQHGFERVRLLVDYGADVNARCTFASGTNALFLAVDTGFLPLVEFLVDKGADLHTKDRRKRDVLQLAKGKKVREFLQSRIEAAE